MLEARLAGGNPPDSWQIHPGWELLGYVQASYCEPITDLYKSEGWDNVVPKDLIDMLTKNGQTYAVLVGVHRGNDLWYNKKVLEKNGIKVGDKMTFAEFFVSTASRALSIWRKSHRLPPAGMSCRGWRKALGD